MKRLPVCLMVILPFGLFIAACGPSPEEIATQTAAAWTPTPVPTETPLPTATPTPVPIDLTAKIVDEQGSPIAGASIVFPQSGNGEVVAADDQGQFAWTNLPGTDGALAVSGQGYFNAEQSLSLERGPNEVAVTLKRDPYGILPAEACAPGETSLALEDFQDGVAQHFGSFQEGLAGLSLGAAPDENANTVLILDSTQGKVGEWVGTNMGYNFLAFGDAVWRLRFMVDNPAVLEPSFNWNEHGPSEFAGQEVVSTNYNVRFWGPPSNTIRLHRQISGPNGLMSDLQGVGQAAIGTFTMQPGQWHYMEISTFQGHLQVWIDGKGEVDYQDLAPLPAGSLGVWFGGPVAEDSTGVIYADAFSVCGLSSPFTSMAPPLPAP